MNTTNAMCDYIGNFILAKGCKNVTFVNECSKDWEIQFSLDHFGLVYKVTPRTTISKFFSFFE